MSSDTQSCATNKAIAKRLEVGQITVGQRRRRYPEEVIGGLYDQLRPGCPRSLDDERVADVIDTARKGPVPHATQSAELF